MLKKINIQIDGIHCKSCKILIESELDVLAGVKDVKVDYHTGECQIEFDDEKISKEKIFEEIEKLNYEVSEENILSAEDATLKEEEKRTEGIKFSKRLIISGVLLLVFAVLYFVVKDSDLLEVLSRLNEKNIGYGLIFLIGVLSSFHCIGMCGGLVVTYTARHQMKNQEQKKEKSTFLPHWQYNLGRIISYTLIGAVLGGVGSFFGVNPNFTGFITLFAGIFMMLMGFSLMTNFKWLEKIKLRTPSFIARFLYNQRHSKKSKGPFIIGILNGFMPCGPLQAMQLYALASGSAISGALSMGIYAMGTVPLMFGFGSFISLVSQERIKQVIKFSGVIVIVLGLFMINRGLVNFDYGFRGVVSDDQIGNSSNVIQDGQEYQTVNMDLTYSGYSPNVLFVKEGVLVRWVINVEEMSGCTNEIIMSDYDIKKKLEYGENIVEFLPEKEGEIKFSCWMKMVWGKFIVTEEGKEPDQSDSSYDTTVPSGSGTCGGGGGSGSCGGTCGQSSCGCSK